MYKNLSSIEVECECGAIHELMAMSVEANSFSSLISCLLENNIKMVRILCSCKFVDDDEINRLIIELKKQGIKFFVTKVPYSVAELFAISKLVYKNEDYVIAYGDAFVYEMAKYYAYSIGVNLSFILTSEFYDFTFSKFARVYDGITFNFYVTTAPECVVYFDNALSNIDILWLKKYLTFKELAYFENILSLRIDEKSICSKINSKLLKIIKNINKIYKPVSLINACIFLGRAMSFFNQTKSFFSSELELSNMLEILSKSELKNCYLVSGKCINLLYLAGLESNLKVLGLNLNKRIDNVKRELSLTAIKCLAIIKKPKTNDFLLKTTRIIKALKYMLMGLLNERASADNVSKISRRELSLALYITPETTSRYTFLNLLRDLGYLENLI